MNNTTSKEKSWTQWFEIPVTDMARAKLFYDTVFETDIEVIEHGPAFSMGIFPHKNVGCALCYAPEHYRPSANGVCVYIDCNPNLQPYLNSIEKAGGTVLSPKKQISEEHGFMATFLDSEGNRLALHSAH